MPPRKQPSPSSDRNTAPILGVLQDRLPDKGRALEIGSGSGQHAAAFAKTFAGITWVPSDPEPQARESIAAWSEEIRLANLAAALDLDAARDDWFEYAGAPYDAMLAINVIHISAWPTTKGLMRGAGRLLKPAGMLYLYGPFRRNGEHTSESNVRFEEWLKGLSPEYGVRDLGDVESEASIHRLALEEVIEMPANNFSVIFRKA